MTINIRDNLLTQGTVAALGRSSGIVPPARKQDGIFAGQLDRALDAHGQAVPSTPARALALAESLNLQMLRTTLSLSGERSDETSSVKSPFTLPPQQLTSLVNAYSANQPETPSKSLPTVEQPSQLQEMAVAAASPRKPSSEAHGLDPIIARASSRYGVDAGLIKSVIMAESNFNPNAVSRAGAQGLMQLMPATARSLGVSDSFDPEQNIMAGTRFLRDLLKRYNGDLDSALAAYNWGPGNVDKKPDQLPRETRNYLARVKQLYTAFSV